MEDAANGLGRSRTADLRVVCENDRHGAAEVTDNLLWYPVGVLLALLAASAVLLFCFPGRWIG